MIKTFFYKLFKLSDLKFLEMQFYTCVMYFNGLDLSIELFSDKKYFQFYLDLYIFKLDFTSSRRCDHHGVNFYLTLFNINFEFMTYDTRHWDDELGVYLD